METDRERCNSQETPTGWKFLRYTGIDRDSRNRICRPLRNTPPRGPSVWTGRALQAESDDLERLVLRFCIRPIDRAFELPAIMDIRARSISFRLGPEGQMGHLITNALARPFSISSFRLADLGEEADYYLRDQPKPSQPSPVGT